MFEHFIEANLLVSQRTDHSEVCGIKLRERKAWEEAAQESALCCCQLDPDQTARQLGGVQARLPGTPCQAE